jgi:hypothetical protein
MPAMPANRAPWVALVADIKHHTPEPIKHRVARLIKRIWNFLSDNALD